MERDLNKFMREQYVIPIRVINRLSKKKRYRLLDIGASKKFLKRFLPKNVRYYSLDYVGKHDWVFDLEKGKLPIKNGFFDIVVCLETLEHITNPEKVMEEMLRIGKKDAIFILSMPNDYNFVLRFYYLIGKKTKMHEPFRTVAEHLHIHVPRVKDIINFFSEYIKIEEVYYGWSSRTALRASGLSGEILKVIDGFINQLAKIYPSLFSRLVSVWGRRKEGN